MKLRLADELAKVSRVLSHENPILGQAPFQHVVVRLATAPDMQRMNGIVTIAAIEPDGQLRGERSVYEEFHAAVAQGLPEGRPIGGCVRA